MTNKDTPVHPFAFQDKFQQQVIFGGITKQEWVALELIKSVWKEVNTEEEYQTLIARCYADAEKFLSYLENKVNGIQS